MSDEPAPRVGQELRGGDGHEHGHRGGGEGGGDDQAGPALRQHHRVPGHGGVLRWTPGKDKSCTRSRGRRGGPAEQEEDRDGQWTSTPSSKICSSTSSHTDTLIGVSGQQSLTHCIQSLLHHHVDTLTYLGWEEDTYIHKWGHQSLTPNSKNCTHPYTSTAPCVASSFAYHAQWPLLVLLLLWWLCYTAIWNRPFQIQYNMWQTFSLSFYASTFVQLYILIWQNTS